jgi:hypothetical protein
MEYSFITAKDCHSIQLGEYSFIYKNNEGQQRIRYAQINCIRLKRPKPIDHRNLFSFATYIIDEPTIHLQSSCAIHITDGPTIHLYSYSIKNNEIKNQFNPYNQFIRVLHFHLMSKSKAKFRYGMSYRNMTIHAMIAIAAVAVSYKLSFLLRDHMVLVYSIVPVVMAFSAVKVLTDKPGYYRPDIIPYHLLPGISSK